MSPPLTSLTRLRRSRHSSEGSSGSEGTTVTTTKTARPRRPAAAAGSWGKRLRPERESPLGLSRSYGSLFCFFGWTFCFAAFRTTPGQAPPSQLLFFTPAAGGMVLRAVQGTEGFLTRVGDQTQGGPARLIARSTVGNGMGSRTTTLRGG